MRVFTPRFVLLAIAVVVFFGVLLPMIQGH